MTGFATVPTHNPGETIPSADWNVIANDLNNGGVMRKIADATLGVAAVSIDFTSIPASFAHLLLVCHLRTTEAVAMSGVSMRFNGDTAANYDFQSEAASAVAQTDVEAFAQTGLTVGGVPGSSAGAGLFAACSVLIPHYTNAAYNKSADIETAVKTGTGTGAMRKQGLAGFWRSNAAINEITLYVASTIDVGSRVTLYGLPQ